MKITVSKQRMKPYTQHSQVPDLTTHMKKTDSLFDVFCSKMSSDKKQQFFQFPEKKQIKRNSEQSYKNNKAIIEQKQNTSSRKSQRGFSINPDRFTYSPKSRQDNKKIKTFLDKQILANRNGLPMNPNIGSRLLSVRIQRIQLGHNSSRNYTSMEKKSSTASRRYSIEKISPNTLLIRKLIAQNLQTTTVSKQTRKSQINNVQHTWKKQEYSPSIAKSDLREQIRQLNNQPSKQKVSIHFTTLSSRISPNGFSVQQNNQAPKQMLNLNYLAKSEVKEVKSPKDIENKALKQDPIKNKEVVNPELEYLV